MVPCSHRIHEAANNIKELINLDMDLSLPSSIPIRGNAFLARIAFSDAKAQHLTRLLTTRNAIIGAPALLDDLSLSIPVARTRRLGCDPTGYVLYSLRDPGFPKTLKGRSVFGYGRSKIWRVRTCRVVINKLFNFINDLFCLRPWAGRWQ